MNVRSPLVIAALLLAMGLPVLADDTPPKNQTPPGNSGSATGAAGAQTQTQSAEDRMRALLGEIETKLRDDHNIAISCNWNDSLCGPLYVTATTASTIELSLDGFSASSPVEIRMTAGELGDNDETVCSGITLPKTWHSVLISVHKSRLWAPTAKERGSKTCADPPPADSPTISIVTHGQSERLRIDFDDGTKHGSLSVPLIYQRWYADTGGLIAFNAVRNERLKTAAANGGKVMITDVRRDERVEPTTGITVNLHPSSYPKFAAQFALSVGRENSRSYYLGAGWRLREAGERALATFSIGLAATEVRRFPGARALIGTPLAADSESLKPAREFAFGPYIGLSLGFSFGNLQPTNPTGQ